MILFEEGIMLRAVVFLSLVITILSLQGKAFGFATFRCNGDIISPGDLSSEVRKKCGEPDHTTQWEIGCKGCWYLAYCYEGECHDLPKRMEGRPIKMECWTYNLSPNQFVRFLRFKDGILVSIKNGDKCREIETGDKCICGEDTFNR
jgi:hypothetical protein